MNFMSNRLIAMFSLEPPGGCPVTPMLKVKPGKRRGREGAGQRPREEGGTWGVRPVPSECRRRNHPLLCRQHPGPAPRALRRLRAHGCASRRGRGDRGPTLHPAAGDVNRCSRVANSPEGPGRAETRRRKRVPRRCKRWPEGSPSPPHSRWRCVRHPAVRAAEVRRGVRGQSLCGGTSFSHKITKFRRRQQRGRCLKAYAKRGAPGRERQMLYDLPWIGNLNQTEKTKQTPRTSEKRRSDLRSLGMGDGAWESWREGSRDTSCHVLGEASSRAVGRSVMEKLLSPFLPVVSVREGEAP